jgi:hypothetical protein
MEMNHAVCLAKNLVSFTVGEEFNTEWQIEWEIDGIL